MAGGVLKDPVIQVMSVEIGSVCLCLGCPSGNGTSALPISCFEKRCFPGSLRIE
jgi:hypothetical protein